MRFITIILFASLLFGTTANAQTGIGTTTPHASAKLDVSSTNKGFLPPRVTLTGVSDASTIPSPAEGLLVYNLGSVGLQAGYYYWNGASWATIATATIAGSGVTASDMVKLYGEAHSKVSGKIGNSTTGYVFTVPVSGRYLFDFTSSATVIRGGTNTIFFTIRQGTSVLGSDNQSSYNNDVHVEYNGKIEVNLQVGVSYNAYNYATSGSFETNDYDRVYMKQVAGNLPVSVYPWVLSGNNVYNTTGKVGIGNSAPNAKLDVRTSPISTTDPGEGFIGIGTTVVSAASAGAGALRFNTTSDLIEFSNGVNWLSLAPGNNPMYSQFTGNASQTFNSAATKMNFPTTVINVGGFSISGNNTVSLPAGRIYRVDLNLGWANLGWARFAIYNASTGQLLSTTAHLEGASSGAYAGSGTTTTFINTSSGSITIDVRYVGSNGTNTSLGDTGNGTNFPSLTIQSVD